MCMRIHVNLFLLLVNLGTNKTRQFVNHSKQTSVSQTFSLSLLCRSNTVGKVDISGRDWICSVAPRLPTLSSSSSQCSPSYYLASAVASKMLARWLTGHFINQRGACQRHSGFLNRLIRRYSVMFVCVCDAGVGRG